MSLSSSTPGGHVTWARHGRRRRGLDGLTGVGTGIFPCEAGGDGKHG